MIWLTMVPEFRHVFGLEVIGNDLELAEVLGGQVQPGSAERLVVIIGAIHGEVVGAGAASIDREPGAGPSVLILDGAGLQESSASREGLPGSSRMRRVSTVLVNWLSLLFNEAGPGFRR